MAFNIVIEKTTVDLMKGLSNMYEKPSASNKVFLMRRLFNLKIAEGAFVTYHINEFNVITTQLSSMEVTFEDGVKALILLSSLPESWSATVIAVSSSSGIAKLKMDNIRDLILSEDIRRKELEESSGSDLSTQSRGRSQQKGKNQIYGRSKSEGKGQKRMQRYCVLELL